jgi:hypothetical protein
MGKLKYLSGGQNKNSFCGIKFCSETGLNTLILSCVACFGHHTYSENGVEKGGLKIKKKN